jgi:hypothetical protein
LILDGFLGENELRRDIERGLVAAAQQGGSAAKAWTEYDRRRAAFSESKAATVLSTLLAGVERRWKGQKFICPVALEEASRLGRDTGPTGAQSREFESDLLFVHDGVAACVEVKAAPSPTELVVATLSA